MGSDADPFIQIPAALSYPMNMKMYDWGLKTEPEPHLGGRQLVTLTQLKRSLVAHQIQQDDLCARACP
jgi:hypothetical protein